MDDSYRSDVEYQTTGCGGIVKNYKDPKEQLLPGVLTASRTQADVEGYYYVLRSPVVGLPAIVKIESKLLSRPYLIT